MLESLKMEGEDVLNDLDIVSRHAAECVETAVNSVEKLCCCVEVDIMKMYPVISQELEELDKQITIIKATLCNNMVREDEKLLEEVWKDKADLSISSNYLLRKMKVKLSNLQRDMNMMMLDIMNLQNTVREMIEAGQTAADNLYDISDEEPNKMLKMYKEVHSLVGSSDLEITLHKVSILRLLEESNLDKQVENKFCNPFHTSEADYWGKGGEDKLRVIKKSEMEEVEEEITNVGKLANVHKVINNKRLVGTRVSEGLTSQIVSSRGKNDQTIKEPDVDAERIYNKDGELEHSSMVETVRPKLLIKSSSKHPAIDPPEQGRNCVSVILKSSRLGKKAVHLNTITKREEKVEQLASRYSPKFGHKSSPGKQVRLDYCFNNKAEARQFFITVHNSELLSPKFLSSFLLTELDLGYEHEPVLTEYDLLAIQSPIYCRNIFRTPILVKVVQEGDVVKLKFKTVTDVNRFLFNKSGTKTTRSLGQLRRRNAVPKTIIPDQDGLYSLLTEERQISQTFGDKHKFIIKPRKECGENPSMLGGNLLLFSHKFELFKFLFSEDAADLDHLQFDKSKIANCLDWKLHD